ncbi:MAG: hypothetical protein JXR60_04325 [Bacteroidales bacterium]|nr:hypothetical protein [Bacteroidales bacterium]
MRSFIIFVILIFSFESYSQTVFSDDFSTDLGWTGYGSGGWARSNATSGGAASSGAANPTADHTATSDNYIIGTYINSSYPNSLSTTYWLVSPVIDCSNYTSVSLNFWSHSGCESSSYDHLYIQVYNGSSWQSVWANGGSYSESAWTNLIYSVSAYADGNANFQVRFGIGTTDGSVTYKGWNIDDFTVVGTQLCTPPANPANPTASANTCGPRDLSFTGSPAAGITWFWQTSASGTDMSNSSSPFNVTTSGTYYLRAYDAGQSCWSTGAGSVTVSVESQPSTPSINDTSLCGGNVTLVAYGDDCLDYNWYDASTGGNLLHTGQSYDINLVADATYYVEAVNQGEFRASYLNTNYYVVDHNTATGDDRGGIAITQDYLYVVGDNNTARLDLPLSLLTATVLTRKDGLFSDLETGQLYEIYNGSASVDGSSFSGYNVTQLRLLNEDLAWDGVTINLSSAIALNNTVTDAGIYAGYGFVILQDGTSNNFWRIDLPTGQVTDFGVVASPGKSTSENWATWGVAEYDNCNYSVVYANNSTDQLVRLNLSDGTTSVAGAFTNLSDMASFTVSPWENRWYFHYEGSGQFGGTTETAGYADATLTFSTGSCASNRDDVSVTMLSTPNAPSIAAFPGAILAGETSTLTGGYAGGTLTWFEADCQGALLGTGTNIDVSPLITTTFYAAVDNGSCFSACDTVTVVVGQPCHIEATADGIYDTLNICAGTSVDIAAVGSCSYLMDNNFDDGSMGVGWESNANPAFDNPCIASEDGTSYLWIGDAATFPRDLITQPYSISEECQICFDFVMAVQGNATPCEGPDEEDEGVSLQWSTDDGATWTDITYFSPDGSQYPSNSFVGSGTSVAENISSDFVSWGNYCFDVPDLAASSATKFRFHQEQVTDFVFDHWGLDNVEISCPTDGQTVTWSYGPTDLDPAADVSPGASTTYTVIIDDGLGFGNSDTAQVHIHIIGTPNVNDDHACVPGDPVTLLANGVGTLEWYDAATGGTLVNTGSSYDISNLWAPDSFYVAEVVPSFSDVNFTFDSDLEGWSTTAPCIGSYNWVWATDGGNGTMFAVDPTSNSSQIINSPIIDVSTWAGSVTLSYTHKFVTESCCDHGYVAYRLDGGAWVQFTPASGSYSGNDGQYNEPLWNACSSSSSMPLYYGSSSAYSAHTGPIDVSTANTLEIAFVFTSDASVGSTGWYINDVSISAGGASACPTSRAVVYAGISDLHPDDNSLAVSCYGNNDGQATALAVDGLGIPQAGIFTYNWDSGENTSTIMDLSAGDYDVTIEDAFGCTTTTTVTVSGPSIPASIVSSTGVSGECNIESPDNWVYIVNESNSNEIIASVFDAAGGTSLFDTEAEATIYGAVQYYNSQAYLPRVVRITPSIQGAATVRIYFTDAEFVALQAADPTILSVNDLTVTKCDDSGTWSNCMLMPAATFSVSPIGSGYYAEVEVTSFSTFYIHKDTGWPLPVELLSFNATCNDDFVKVDWITSTETNNNYFVLERSYDLNQYEFIAQIEGTGNSNVETKYTYEDYTNDGRKSYYRLLQVDFDGKTEYHPMTSVDCQSEKMFGIVAFQTGSNEIVIKANVPEGKYILNITDNTGKAIYSDAVRVNFEGEEFSITDYSIVAGMYNVKLSENDNIYSVKLVIRK